MERLKRYRVWLRSRPGMYEQYNGKVDVVAADEAEAEQKAYAELRRGAFPERGSSAWWVVERIECTGTSG